METHLKITGIILIVLSMVHIAFPRYFKWVDELGPLSLINRQMMYVHTFFVAFVLLLMGILCLSSAADMPATVLGKRLSLGLGIFWLVRLFIQFFVYSSKLWRGKRFETGIHILFALLWTYFSAVFLATYLR